MKIEFKKIKGTLKEKSDTELFSALRQIDCDDRYKINSMIFEANKEYQFIGKIGQLTVTFEESDLN